MNIKILDSSVSVPNDMIVRLKEMGNITEIMYSQNRSSGGYIKKIDKERYLDIRSGEIFNFNHMESRADDLSNVSKSLAQGRDIINANITDVSFCRWVTLTYAENMTDTQKLYFDFKNFNKRCRKIFGHYEYITAAEPQARGAWHLHCVFIFSEKAPYMSNDIVSACWRQGFVTVKRLDDVDNVGAYLTAYLGDMEFTEAFNSGCSLSSAKGIKQVEYDDENGNKQMKKYIKGARLCMYPPGFHIFRWSKGIKKPDLSLVPYSFAKDKVKNSKCTFLKAVSLEDDKTGFKNVLQYEYFNSKRGV